MRSLAIDGFRPSILGFLIVTALLGGWAYWLFTSRVSVYEISESARIEVDTAVYPISSSIEGRVVASHLAPGKQVQAGDLLVEMEDESERLRMNEAATARTTLSPQMAGLRDEIKAEEDSLREQIRVLEAATQKARKEHEEAEASARLAQEEADRLTRLHASGVVPEVELSRARTEAQRRRAAADALAIEVTRFQSERRSRESDSRVRIERLNRQIAAIEGQMTTSTSTINRLEYEIERRRIRAPIAGRLGEAAELRVGSVVHVGDQIGAIVPASGLRVVAHFRPSSALGRIGPGQPAELRLEGFPWGQYGSIRATVSNVTNEPRDGRIRVELAIETDPLSPIPLQHGLPGTVEVEVERISPANLLMRAVGKRLGAPQQAAPAPNEQKEGR
jgi:membrane fusion protein (multidrug efflux system)